MNIKYVSQYLMGFIISALASTALAFNNEVTLDFQDAHIKGQNVIFLKKALKDQYPHLNLHHQHLKHVVVVGKSKHGHGQVRMRVKDWVSAPEIVAGNRYNFHKNKQRSFDYITLHNNQYASNGRWQLLLKGNFKIRKVIMVMEDDRLASRSWWKPLNNRVPKHKRQDDYRSATTWGQHSAKREYFAYH